MFRTRDFVLILVSVIFLLVAIGSTLIHQSSDTNMIDQVDFFPSEEVDYQAEVFSPETVSREKRIATMREKIAAGQALSLVKPTIVANPETDESLSPVATAAEVVEPDSLVLNLQQCANYSAYVGNWVPLGIKFEVTEGARLVYREGGIPDELNNLTKEILLQLPMYAVPTKNQTACLQSDVVGIAQDGSLIRNNEAGMYSVFGADTLVGYALDGFPIYGASDTATDACGGTIEARQYRYYLSSDRDTVINCFSANPVRL